MVLIFRLVLIDSAETVVRLTTAVPRSAPSDAPSTRFLWPQDVDDRVGSLVWCATAAAVFVMVVVAVIVAVLTVSGLRSVAKITLALFHTNCSPAS